MKEEPQRKSGRSRSQVRSYYEDAKDSLENEERKRNASFSKSSRKRSKLDSSSLNHTSPDSSEAEQSVSITSDISEKTPSQQKKTDILPIFKVSSRNGGKTKTDKIQIKFNVDKITKKRDVNTNVSKAKYSALSSLSKKVLCAEENPENSLVASLLSSYRTNQDSDSLQINQLDASSNSQPTTVYSSKLTAEAKKIVRLHNEDENAAQVALLNFIFRSVGGTVNTFLDANEIQLEEMDSEQWGNIVTDLADDMRHTPIDSILFCADPAGALHASTIYDKAESDGECLETSGLPLTQSSLGVREYRKIFEEFWYILGKIALSEGNMSSNVITPEDNNIQSLSQNDAQKSKKAKGLTNVGSSTTIRFDAELVRDLISRVSDLVSVGQPDIRAAATTAILYLGHAVIDTTMHLTGKIDTTSRQLRAASGAKGSTKKKIGTKVESLTNQIDFLKRSRADLEEVILGPVIKGLFGHRYRDSNWWIRSSCLDALSRMMLQRPDLFMTDYYLKYFGWMLSDKVECVRISSLNGLLKPFEVAEKYSASSSGSSIDISLLEHVSTKFLSRIADCVIDTTIPVQEKAMKLMLYLLRNGFLDEIEDEKMWNQVNLRALARDTSQEMRIDALYFIMEQLEAFDECAESDEGIKYKNKRNTSSNQDLDDRRSALQLDALASWASHALTDGPIPVEEIKIELVDHLVVSLRQMPNHKSIVTRWSVILKAINEDNIATTSQGKFAGDKADLAKQRVLVQMLSCAARLEVGPLINSIKLENLEQEIKECMAKDKHVKGTKKLISSSTVHESLSIALVQALPLLLIKFKSDYIILRSLTSLPQYFIPSVFSLLQRKTDFISLFKNLSDIFLESSDDIVLYNVSLSISTLCSNTHIRAPDAKAVLNKTIAKICSKIKDGLEKLVESLKSDDVNSSQSNSSVHSSVTGSRNEENDSNHVLYLNYKRLRFLAKRMDLTHHFPFDSDDCENGLEQICNITYTTFTKVLKAGMDKISKSEGMTEDKIDLCEINSFHCSAVAFTIHEGLLFMLCTVAWKLCPILKHEALLTKEDDDHGDRDSTRHNHSDSKDESIIKFRNNLLSLLELCFAQYIEDEESDQNMKCWSDSIQKSGAICASDMRSLFPREWENASSPLLRKLAITDDARLIGGCVRFFRSKEQDRLRRVNKFDDSQGDLVKPLLLSLGRSLVTNWKVGNRREAGVALAHMTGSGPGASQIVTSLSRLLKKMEPVRLLEAQMASLRQSYEDWLDNEPEDIDSINPTDKEMELLDEAEKEHVIQFHHLEQRAFKFSMSLGVNKLSDKKLAPAIVGFIREGIRYSFSSCGESGEDDVILGSRLSFLNIMSKYVHWVKKLKVQEDIFSEILKAKSEELKSNDEFEEVHSDDLEALAEFASLFKVDTTRIFHENTSPESSLDQNIETSDHQTIQSDHKPYSQSIGSALSHLSSVRGDLSPLYEEKNLSYDRDSNNSLESSLSQKRP